MRVYFTFFSYFVIVGASRCQLLTRIRSKRETICLFSYLRPEMTATLHFLTACVILGLLEHYNKATPLRRFLALRGCVQR